MRTYISGAVTRQENYQQLFEEGARELIDKGHDPVLPIDLPHNHDKKWASYMKEALICMLECEAVYFLKNWKESAGAKVEYDLAKALHMKIMMQ